MIEDALAALVLVGVAELGDKSQLVCMTLAARYRPLPVILGALAAFSLLNALAVGVGGALAVWVPERWLAGLVAVLFLAFGVNTLREALSAGDEALQAPELSGGRGAFANTFGLLFLAELGDKTQIAVAGLSVNHRPMAVWLGATLALTATSVLGVFAGRALLAVVPLRAVRLAAGALFLLFGALAAWRVITAAP